MSTTTTKPTLCTPAFTWHPVGNSRNRINYDVVGRGANVCGIGANVDTRLGFKWRFREVLAGGNGYPGQNELIVLVGLDHASVVDEIVVTWPNCDPRTMSNIGVNQTYPLYPPERLGDSDGDIDVVNTAVFVDVVLGTDTDIDHILINNMNGEGRNDGEDVNPFVSQALSPP